MSIYFREAREKKRKKKEEKEENNKRNGSEKLTSPYGLGVYHWR